MRGRNFNLSTPLRLPRFDVTIMERVVLGGRDSGSLKRDVYALFESHPHLLRSPEQLSKSSHRELVRECLRLLLKQGYSPLSYFVKDPQAYFNLGEYLSLVDLSLTVKMVGIDLGRHALACSDALTRPARLVRSPGRSILAMGGLDPEPGNGEASENVLHGRRPVSDPRLLRDDGAQARVKCGGATDRGRLGSLD